MNASAATRLRLDTQRTTLTAESAPEVALAVGARDIAGRFFRHAPPTPFELERAIDAVEDALTSSRLQHAARGELVTNDPLLREWVTASSPQGDGVRLTRDEVEAMFQRLASASLGHPPALAGLPTEGDAAAALLILRECMHHLGYGGIRFAAH